ncbi:MAG TPA: phage baseplate assembly protein V, partial [Nocardioides sp.]
MREDATPERLERVVAGLVEQAERRYWGKYRGWVVDTEDPARLGRLKLSVPSVLGKDVVTGWASPCAPYGGAADRGLFLVPERESGVWVEFEEGDLEFPIWVGTFWTRPDDGSQAPKPNVPADASEADEPQSPPTRKILKTARGHTLQFEDADTDDDV